MTFSSSAVSLAHIVYDHIEHLQLNALFISLASLVVLYHAIAPFFPNDKQKSWILTTISSASMTLASLPFVWDYATTGGTITDVRHFDVWAYYTCRFFQAYLIADLLMGFVHYRKRVNPLTGWFHHIVYVWIVEYAVRMEWGYIFCLAAFMELPTFVLAIASLFPRLRHDVLFASTFLCTRILLHVVLCVSTLSNRAALTDGSVGPSIILACVFPLHAFWFYGCLKGFVARARAARSRTTSTATSTPAQSTPAPRRPAPTTEQHSPAPSPTLSLRIRPHAAAARRRGLRQALRSVNWRWTRVADLRDAAGRMGLGGVRENLRAALPGRESVYAFVGLERRRRGVVDGAARSVGVM
ncbi:hypothetical protein CONPUDRAFT_85277 [Coniophora puteana RWD-64-598 SS2]|uniref:Uncharacterized protein n=1 Tax=Coniophora puteana (strain RWD-64-598) TaxID=741705 RepID=A0A5M3M8Q5_CONPW|nr:uncharacterized protein CONPUDRAFT_85277 [Coniophora puteana RWD-64-598 SS2]EIW75447.1 hypothetical protein CONPUDRAFT_85277 [Coniophora puteana RWD-64-598 SS2]